MRTVVIGMSGGVDSSVSAYLLKQQGFRVIALFMKNWEERSPLGECRSSVDYADAAAICDRLDIPLYTVNFVDSYFDRVFSTFIEELKLGYTPNPDILCNREIKFSALLDKAKSFGADYLATGHYCQIRNGELTKGADLNKDQSYFLYTLKKEILEQVLFPVGHLSKPEVRGIAKNAHLPVHDKKDSTGICFIGKRDFKEFISQYIPYQKGPFETVDGKVIGEHDGAAYYTIGQRKGLGIGGPGEAWFVVRKEIERNVVVLAQGDDHKDLYASTLVASDATFIKDTPPSPTPYRCEAKIRYRQETQGCQIESIHDGELRVHFDKPQRAITPRQSIVFYDGDICLGGALIRHAVT